MITNENKERGVAENERANYTPTDKKEGKDKKEQDHPDIKETENESEKDDTGGDLAGNAASNSDPDE